jgi:hypothetical protein
MLAEKFFLVLETLRSQAPDDKPWIVVSTAHHVPMTAPQVDRATVDAAKPALIPH